MAERRGRITRAVSGAGKAAVDELRAQTRAILNAEQPVCNAFPHPIAFNCLPHIGDFEDSGYSTEEIKMVNETQKIMGDDRIRITATTVRVPVHTGHSESVNIETRKKLTADRAREILEDAPGVIVCDDLANNRYPTALEAAGKGDTFVGRIREDGSHPTALDLWIVSDNLLKGAAYNAVQIAELL